MIYNKQDDIYLTFNVLKSINDGEYWRGNIKWTIQKNWQHRSHKTKRKNKNKNKKNPNTMCVGHHYLHANTNNVNKTWAFLQTIGGKDEPTIVWSLCLCLPVSNDPERLCKPILWYINLPEISYGVGFVI